MEKELIFITAFKKTTGDQPVDELNADVSSSFRGGNPARYGGEDVIKETDPIPVLGQRGV